MLYYEPQKCYYWLMIYNWQQKDWPHFTYDLSSVEDDLFAFAEQVGRVSGMLEALPEDTRIDVIISTMVAEAVKTSEIEGEFISREDIMSSIRNNLGLNKEPERIRDQRASGVAELMLDVRESYQDPLDQDKLFSWHEMLMKGNHYVQIGKWRTHEEPMQVVSGPMGKEKVYFEAPPSAQVPQEMEQFIAWFNSGLTNDKRTVRYAPVRSAIAHLYFESIHPFEDGNGRIGRAISEKALSQGVGRPILLSLSQTIESDKKAYYNALHEASRSNEITDWIQYFVSTLLQAQNNAEELVSFIVKKAHFFDRYKDQMNLRQMKVIKRMLDEGPKGFEGGMNARKYVGITKASKATATRDLQDLAEKKILVILGTGRGTRYQMNI